ncbi:GATOR complex protein WDR24-like [Octopus bimaculoides]|uniref:GATOR complex protein WDR24-like n=1 Tax=Octopus bimaculoides TaxID=37653 RepID=UPI0022E83E62|nr:GATOR complex protein WDR24-like [Octopus bimaculoides]
MTKSKNGNCCNTNNKHDDRHNSQNKNNSCSNRRNNTIKNCKQFETVPSGSVPSPSETKSSKQPEGKRKKSNGRKERLDKINLVCHQHYHAVSDIDFSMQELVYLVINAITIKDVFGKETKFSNTR